MASGLKYPVHSEQKTRSFVKKKGGLADLRNRIYILRESSVLYLARLMGLVGLF